MTMAAPGTATVTSCQVQSLLPGAVGLLPWPSKGLVAVDSDLGPLTARCSPAWPARPVARSCPRKVTVRPR
jgi:hypothetical protein